MTVAEKTKMKEIQELVERIVNQNKRIEQKLKALQLDEIRAKIDENQLKIEERALKSETDEKLIELMQGNTSTNSVLSNLEGEVDKNRQRVDGKLEELGDQGRQRTASIQ